MITYQQYYIPSSYGYQSQPVNKHLITKQLAYLIEKNIQRQNSSMITVYIKYQNQGWKLQINKFIKLQELNQIISKKINISKDQQILYINGKQLTNNSSQQTNITCEMMNNKQIIYVKNKNRKRPEYYSIIQLSVKIFLPLNFTQLTFKSFNLRFCSDQKLSKLSELILSLDYYQPIISFINQENKFNINFTQSGRILDSQKTFLQNNLSTNCLVNCIISEHPIQVQNKSIILEQQKKRKDQSDYQTKVLCSQNTNININTNNINQNVKIQEQQNYKITIKNPQIQIYEEKLIKQNQLMKDNFMKNKIDQNNNKRSINQLQTQQIRKQRIVIQLIKLKIISTSTIIIYKNIKKNKQK